LSHVREWFAVNGEVYAEGIAPPVAKLKQDRFHAEMLDRIPSLNQESQRINSALFFGEGQAIGSPFGCAKLSSDRAM
jgi:hypothetical protein